MINIAASSSADGSSTVCEGGRSCTVTQDGTYLVINHSTSTRTTVVVGSGTSSGGGATTGGSGTDTGGETDGSGSSAGVTVEGRTISWPDDGWYQVQTADGSVTVCEGGRSCVVSSGGTYIVINHSNNTRSTVVVD